MCGAKLIWNWTGELSQYCCFYSVFTLRPDFIYKCKIYGNKQLYSVVTEAQKVGWIHWCVKLFHFFKRLYCTEMLAYIDYYVWFCIYDVLYDLYYGMLAFHLEYLHDLKYVFKF